MRYCFYFSTNEWEFPHFKLVLWHSGTVVNILLRPEFDFLPGQNLSVRSLHVPFMFVWTPSRYFQQVCTACWRMESFSVNKLIGQKSHLQSTSIKLRCLAVFSQNLAKSQCFWLILNKTPRGPAAARRSQQLKSSLLYILVVFAPLWLPVVSFCDLLSNQRYLMSRNGSCYLNSMRPPPPEVLMQHWIVMECEWRLSSSRGRHHHCTTNHPPLDVKWTTKNGAFSSSI